MFPGSPGKMASPGRNRQAFRSVDRCTNIWYQRIMVAKNTSVSLGEHFTAFAQDQVASGRYSSMSDVLRAGLRLLEDEELKVETLRSAIEEGLASGDPVPFDFDAWLAAKSTAA